MVTSAGYAVPKYMLEAHGRSLFRHDVESFEKYFSSTPFLFVFRHIPGTREFVERQCADMGIADARLVALDGPTRGQAETVLQGIDAARVGDATPLTIFNIDSMRPGFSQPDWAGACDGYLEVFEGEGEHWSFVEPAPDGSNRVARTTEKDRISALCSNGLYFFADAGSFRHAVRAHARKADSELQAGELYIAPLYNDLIARGKDIRYRLVGPDAVVFSGTPDEYERFKNLQSYGGPHDSHHF